MKKIKDNRCSAVVEIRYPKRNLKKEIKALKKPISIKKIKESCKFKMLLDKECYQEIRIENIKYNQALYDVLELIDK